MVQISLRKAAYLFSLLANISHAAEDIDGDKSSRIGGPRGEPSVSHTGAAFRPRPTGRWISPEYKWFFDYPLPIPTTKRPKLTWTDDYSSTVIDYYEVEIKRFNKQIYPDLPATPLVGYDGESPGPTFHMQKGREAVVRFTNDGPSKSSVHVHGQYNRAPFDGWAAATSDPDQYKDYYYPNAQNARTIWYHDHTEYTTGENAYRGQEGFYLLQDPQEQSLGLPSGNYDVAMALASKMYNKDGTLLYETNNNSGLWGDVIHVNGQPWPYFKVEPRKYRLRLLNAAVSRTFQLSFVPDEIMGFGSQPLEFQVIASDGGLFEHPVTTKSLAFSMGERYEAVVDFSNLKGQNITLRNERGIGENADYAATDFVMRFIVGEIINDNSDNGDVPENLRTIPPTPNAAPSKDFTFGRNDAGEWVINGVGFSDIEHRILTRPKRGDDEIWVLHNGNGNGTHPVHIHLVDFRVISRTGGRNEVLPYESAGMKDVVWLSGGETVKVLARYAPWDGVYMFHCHNLVHEDHDMLVAFNVTQLEHWGYTNDTRFIDPENPEFAARDQNPEDYTTEAILKKVAWFWSTDAYNKGNVDGVYSALDAYSTLGYAAPQSTIAAYSSTGENTDATTLQTVTGTALNASPSSNSNH